MHTGSLEPVDQSTEPGVVKESQIKVPLVSAVRESDPDGPFRQVFISDMLKIRDQHAELVQQLATYRRTVKIMLTSGGVVLGIAGFFGWDKYQQIDEKIERTVESALRPRLAHLDSINTRVDQAEARVVAADDEIRQRQSETAIASELSQRAARDVRHQDSLAQRLVQEVAVTARAGQSEAIALQDTIARRHQRIQELGTSIESLAVETDASARRMLTSAPRNPRLMPRQVGFSFGQFNYRADPGNLQFFPVPTPFSATSPIDVYVNVSAKGASDAAFLLLSIGTQQNNGEFSPRCVELFSVHEGLNHLYCRYLPAGSYSMLVALVPKNYRRMHPPTYIGEWREITVNSY
jgi:hypothetical protein